VSYAELIVEHGTSGVTASLAVTDVVVAESFRSGGLCPDQVDRLVELGGAWPPLLVHRCGHVLIDGQHRLEAARRLGLRRIEAELFDGTPQEAFIEFVRRNVTHGLTLTLGERKQAAMQVLRVNHSWSDRRIAELCALSPKTVGRLRLSVGASPRGDVSDSDDVVRWGRDDRRRPVRRGAVRARVVDALREQPDASLRTIATAVGVSPETVRLVRLNLAQVPAAAGEDLADDPVAGDVEELMAWRADAALTSSCEGDDFLVWFERSAIAEPDLDRAGSVPLSRVYVIADEARRRADMWMRFARSLEARPGRTP